MTPHDFLTKWRGAELKERSGSQSHFNDLCVLLGLANPAAADRKGEWFTFEKGASKTGGGEGWADVWRRDCFAWEYKGPGKDLDRALQQLLRYARSLENPPLLIVSDMTVIRVHTNFTNTVEEVHLFTLDDLLDGDKRERLKQAFIDPDAFRPAKTRAMLTEQVAREFATLAQRLRDRGHEATAVAHFVVRCAFCMFAEDVELLPNKMFERLVAESRRNPDEFVELAGDLFRLMRTGGRLGLERVAWFNGGLFDDDVALPLNRVDLDLLHDACKQHWAEIDPSILGTLFERGLDPGKRSQLGAHYTDRAKIELIVDPTIAGPLTAEWVGLRDRVTAEVEAAETTAAALRERAGVHGELKAEVRELEGALARGRQPDLFPDAPRRKLVRELDALAAEVRAATARVRAARAAVRAARDGFMAKLRAFRVLDPACGSGNFLYVALKLLKDIEHRVNVDAEALGVPVVTPEVGPANVLGIELNPFAAELARTSVWIGDIQWMRKNGFEPSRDPVLKPLTTIECRDAVLSELDPPQLAGEGDHAKHGGGAADPGERLVADAPPPLASGERSPSPSGGGSRRAAWPAADVIIGNPPFLGNKKMIAELGEDYTRALRATYPEVPGGVDLVCYWFAKAWAAIVAGRTQRSGLVSTQSIRRGTNRKVLQPVVDEGRIFYALSDEEWTVEGADVRVSLICFGRDRSGLSTLDRQSVARIGADLSSDGDGRRPNILQTNLHVAGQGTISGGPFEVPPSVARRMLAAPLNPNLQSNSAVVRPWRNGDDLTDRPADWWIIDFGSTLALDDAALFELPLLYCETRGPRRSLAARRQANDCSVRVKQRARRAGGYFRGDAIDYSQRCKGRLGILLPLGCPNTGSSSGLRRKSFQTLA
ncbi:DNA methyltransferase [Sphingomonas sp.]|uniref:DNA methyltransferase n=1 Tax=Sphingomonas sp. TaxID=28214 RepID=UPI003CC5963B